MLATAFSTAVDPRLSIWMAACDLACGVRPARLVGEDSTQLGEMVESSVLVGIQTYLLAASYDARFFINRKRWFKLSVGVTCHRYLFKIEGLFTRVGRWDFRNGLI
jgi:hypothetical protein